MALAQAWTKSILNYKNEKEKKKQIDTNDSGLTIAFDFRPNVKRKFKVIDQI